MPSSILSMSIDKTENLSIIVGNTYAFDISIKNLSTVQRLYNIGFSITLPDGMSLSAASILQTSSITNNDNSTTYSWINLKDLAPIEVSFKLNVTVKCNTKFKNGNAIPFGYNFPGISVICQADTKPRGTYDTGNQVIYQTISMSFVTVRFLGTITTASKILKGAGTSLSLTDYTQVNTATCKFVNNSSSISLVNITILLPDGIRYIGNVSASGTDANKLSSPSISTVKIDNILYTQIYFGNISLSVSSSTTLNFNYAIWNQYNNNLGELIPHGTKFNMYANMNSADPLITASSNSSVSFSAMDLIINTSTNKTIVDVQTNVIYTYVFKTGQYYNIQNVTVHYLLPDGVYYLSGSPAPASAVDSPSLNGYYLTYSFPLAAQNSTRTVNINAKIDSYYRYKLDAQLLNMPIAASDPFTASTDISGILPIIQTTVNDSSNVNSSINIGSITKQFIKGYYKDGTAKNIISLAPGDFAEYTLTYNASSLKAVQKQVYIDDFFPLSSDPLNNLSYNFTGINPATEPQLISPHGVDFYYGDLSGQSYGTINFKAPIALPGSSTQNANLMKLKGINTYGTSYSSRTQVNFNIGAPNLTLTKSISGPNKNAIQSNEIYTYTVVFSNSNNLGTETDAFDFTLTDTMSSWFALNTDSLNINCSGSYNPPVIQNNTISVYIKKLSPGQSLTLTYKVTISSVLPPGINITTTTSNTNPYSQVYDAGSTNYQYSNLNKSASVTLSSLPITLTKTNLSGTFKIDSPITYTLTAVVPQGTIAYGLYLKDILPSGGQTYLGPSYLKESEVIPVISSNTITFPLIGNVDARIKAQSITYITTTKITSASKTVNTLTSTQSNTLQCLYTQTPAGPYTTLSKSLTVTINHPNILMSLSVSDKTTTSVYTQSANISINSLLQFKLIFQNNSAIKLINGIIEIPIANSFLFNSINTTVLCSASYNTSSKKIIINIPELNPSASGYVYYTVVPNSSLRAGSSITTQASAVSYYNDISATKVYSGEKSNIITCALPPGVSLLPDPLHKINDSTSFIVTAPGNTSVIYDYFKNTGGGYDDFTLTVQKASVPYTLYIDGIMIAQVPANTLYQNNLAAMSNLAPNTDKVIKITVVIPLLQPLGTRYDFSVTVKSKTPPYPEKTILNIDPHPF